MTGRTRRLQRAATLLLAAVALAMLVMLIRQVRRHAAPGEPPTGPARTIPQTLIAEDEGGPLGLPDVAAPSAIAGAEPLSSEPAGLAPPPSGERLIGYQRRVDGRAEQVAVWRVDSPVAAVAEHYAREAGARGYEPLRDVRGGDESIRHRLYVSGDRLLGVRVHRAGDTTRVVIQLRYTRGDAVDGRASHPPGRPRSP